MMGYILPKILIGSSNHERVIATLSVRNSQLGFGKDGEPQRGFRLNHLELTPPDFFIVRIYPDVNVPTKDQFPVHHCRGVW